LGEDGICEADRGAVELEVDFIGVDKERAAKGIQEGAEGNLRTGIRKSKDPLVEIEGWIRIDCEAEEIFWVFFGEEL
jgi:hypothetical protein